MIHQLWSSAARCWAQHWARPGARRWQLQSQGQGLGRVGMQLGWQPRPAGCWHGCPWGSWWVELGALEQRLGPLLGLELPGFCSVESGPRLGLYAAARQGPQRWAGQGLWCERSL